MKAKLALVGFMMAAAAAYPVLSIAQSFGHGHGTTSHGNTGHGQNQNQHALGTGVYCDDSDDDFFNDGGYTRWVSNGHGQYTFQFGQANTGDDTDDSVGLRIETSAAARTVSADWNLGQSDVPALLVILTNSSGLLQYRNFELGSTNTPITKTPLGNSGFTRITYSAAADGYTGATFNGVYWYDSDVETNNNNEQLRNVLVNGQPVQPTFIGTQLDCTM